jgi:hypothetical protein
MGFSYISGYLVGAQPFRYLWRNLSLQTLKSLDATFLNIWTAIYFLRKKTWQKCWRCLPRLATHVVRQRQSTLDCRYLTLLIMWQFEKENVPPKLFFLILFWEFVIFFHYSTAKLFHYGLKNNTSRSKNDFLGFKRFFDLEVFIFQSIKKFWRNILFLKLSHNWVRYRQSSVDCLCW